MELILLNLSGKFHPMGTPQFLVCSSTPPHNFLHLLDYHYANSSSIVMSSSADYAEILKCLKVGCDDCYLKPVRLEVLKHLWQSIWRKRKETLYMNMLETERKQKQVMEGQMRELELGIEKAVDAPLTSIVKTVSLLLEKQELSAETKAALSTIMRDLQTSNLYQPAIATLLGQDNVDESVRNWISSELVQRRDSIAIDIDSETPCLESETLKEKKTRRRSVLSWGKGAKVLVNMTGFDFNPWDHDEEELEGGLITLFMDFNFERELGIDVPALRRFIHAVRKGYKVSNPYHNFRHAVDVVQHLYLQLTSGNGSSKLDTLSVFCLLIAALCHDLQHPGVNNNFLIQTEDELAIRYNDTAVLESYHASQTFELLQNKNLDFFNDISPKDRKSCRAAIIGCILATDLAAHMEYVNKFKAHFHTAAEASSAVPMQGSERQLLMEMMIKCADVSNPSRPFKVATAWSSVVVEEFFRQGDTEKQLGLPVSPFMDRAKPMRLKMSCSFIDFVVLPSFQLLLNVLPGMQPSVDYLIENRSIWNSGKADEESESANQAPTE
jgi:hypothetical protein